MSDIQQGPDWWLASDGRWYPPTSIPGYSASIPLPSAGVSTWIQILWWAIIPLGLITAGLGNQALSKVQIWGRSGSPRSLDSWLEIHEGFAGALGLTLMLLLANFILVIIWTNSAHKHQASYDPPNRRWSSGWAIGSWFIPLANFVIPKLVLNEIERVAVAGRDEADLTPSNWRETKLGMQGRLYWLGWVCSSICFGISTLAWDAQLDIRHTEDIVLDNVEVFYQLNIAGSILIAVAGFFGAVYYRYLTRQLRANAATS